MSTKTLPLETSDFYDGIKLFAIRAERHAADLANVFSGPKPEPKAAKQHLKDLKLMIVLLQIEIKKFTDKK